MGASEKEINEQMINGLPFYGQRAQGMFSFFVWFLKTSYVVIMRAYAVEKFVDQS